MYVTVNPSYFTWHHGDDPTDKPPTYHVCKRWGDWDDGYPPDYLTVFRCDEMYGVIRSALPMNWDLL